MVECMKSCCTSWWSDVHQEQQKAKIDFILCFCCNASKSPQNKTRQTRLPSLKTRADVFLSRFIWPDRWVMHNATAWQGPRMAQLCVHLIVLPTRSLVQIRLDSVSAANTQKTLCWLLRGPTCETLWGLWGVSPEELFKTCLTVQMALALRLGWGGWVLVYQKGDKAGDGRSKFLWKSPCKKLKIHREECWR